MYVVTNREYHPRARKLENVFGGSANHPGDELRLAEVTGKPGAYRYTVFEETPAMRSGKELWPSETLFQQLQARMRSSRGKNVVFFVHGYNTSFVEALDSAHALEKRYDVEVILFTWPSDGKLLRYKSDKRDAIASHLALDRALERLGGYMRKHITEENACGRGFTMLCHSMGNYLFKWLLKSSQYQGETLLFDNVILAAADVNAHDHIAWIDRIQARNRVYVTINEDDQALYASRLKFGEQQRARLGQTVGGSKSKLAVYLNFSEATAVGDSHSYFLDVPVSKNRRMKKVFEKILRGERCESDLEYDAATETYRVP